MKRNVIPQKPKRVILTSDIHYTYNRKWYGISNEERVEHWLDAINKEHERSSIDMIIFAGDVSLDHYLLEGTYTADGVSMTKVFIDKYASQLPKGIPMFIAAGNHELYSNEQWKAITGNERYGTMILGNDLFIITDSYGAPLEPEFNGGPERYTPVDVDFIKSKIGEYPDKRVWLVSHWFEKNAESAEFKKLVKENGRIIGLFAGHTHKSELLPLGEEFGNKVLAQTGEFSYSYYTPFPTEDDKDLYDSFWGFRELLIWDDHAESSYIVAETHIPTYKERKYDLERKLVHQIKYSY